MSKSSERRRIRKEIKGLQTLETNLIKIIRETKGAYESLEKGKNKATNVYSINDDITPLITKMSDLESDISETSNYLKSTIIPNIESRIEELYDELEELEDDD